MEHGYLLNKDVNDEFYYKFSKKGEFGQIEFVTEKVTLIGIERTESEIFKYIAKCTFKGKTFYCSDWKLEKEVIEETIIGISIEEDETIETADKKAPATKEKAVKK
jgi:hypothetical protein